MERLSSEALTCILIALTRLSPASSLLSNLLVSLSSRSPRLFAKNLSNIDDSYNLWLSLPIPPDVQLSNLRQTLDANPATRYRSLKATNGPLVLDLPLWILGYWTWLTKLAAHCRSWERSIEWLERQASGSHSNLAVECLSKLSSLPLDISLPNLHSFSTSHLPTFLGNHWLSDDHINVGVDYINSHPSCNPQLRLLNSFFLSTLELNQQTRRNLSSMSRPACQLQNLLSDQHVTQLLIPVHQPSHWTALLVDISAQTYTYFDSLCPEMYNAPSVCVGLVNGWLSEALHLNCQLSPVPSRHSHDQQTDSHSCGVAVLSTMAHIALGGSFDPWRQAVSGEEQVHWMLQLTEGTSLWVS